MNGSRRVIYSASRIPRWRSVGGHAQPRQNLKRLFIKSERTGRYTRIGSERSLARSRVKTRRVYLALILGWREGEGIKGWYYNSRLSLVFVKYICWENGVKRVEEGLVVETLFFLNVPSRISRSGTGFVFYATLVLETLKNLEGEREEKTIILILIFRKIKILFMGRECICTFFCDSLL